MKNLYCLLAAMFLFAGTSCAAHSYISISHQKFAEEAIRELIPLIEGISGEKFAYVPRIEMTEPGAVGEVIAKENSGLLKRLGKFMTQDELSYIERFGSFDTHRIMAKYSPLNKTIYLLPGNFGSNPAWRKLTIKQERDIFMLIICHELAHALSDQQYSLFEYIKQVNSLDESHALNACIEGYAVFITKKVAAGLGSDLSEYREFLDGRFEYGISKPEDMAVKMNTELMNFFYLSGSAFFERIFAEEGMKGVNNILRSPPRHSDIILYPQRRRSAAPKKIVSLAKITSGLREIPIFDDWQYVEKTFGSALFKSVLIAGGFSEHDAAKILKNYTTGAQSVWYRGDKFFTINVLAFVDKKSAEEFVRMDRKNIKKLSDNDLISLKNSEYITVKGADSAWADEYSVSVFFKKDNYFNVGFVRDFLVVDIQCVNSPELCGHQDVVRGRILANILKQK